MAIATPVPPLGVRTIPEPNELSWRWVALKTIAIRWTDDAANENTATVDIHWDQHELDLGKPAAMSQNTWELVVDDLTRYFLGRDCWSFDKAGGL